jgi:O-antigen ligase
MILENPLMGIGIGNWKLESIKTDSNNLKGYTVPYHSHNDFLEIGAETGIFGMIAFILLLIYPLIFFEKEINIKNLILLFSFIIYIFDSLINFPFARPANILIFLLILAFSYKKIELIKNA